MSLDKSIQYGKEQRVQYRRSLAFDRSCRNHGNCGYCESNRTIQSQRELRRIESQEHDLDDPCYLDDLINGEITVEEWNKRVDAHDDLHNDWDAYVRYIR